MPRALDAPLLPGHRDRLSAVCPALCSHRNIAEALGARLGRRRRGPPAASVQSPPKVLFAEKPAELLVFRDKPAFLKIQGTSLSYAANTGQSIRSAR